MFLSITEAKHVFLKPQPSKVILMVPLCAKTIILFCDDHSFYHYSLTQSKLLYQSKLPGRPIRAKAISDYQIICSILDKKKLLLLDIRDQQLTEILKLPHSSVYNEGKQKEILTLTTLHCFQETRSFYIQEPRFQENKTRIIFTKRQAISPTINKKDFNFIDIDTKQQTVKKLDQTSSIIVFKQTTQQNGIYKFKILDCSSNFQQKQYTVEHKAFTPFSIVRQIRKINHHKEQEKYLMFVNAQTPQILIFNGYEIKDSGYQSNKVFLETVLINVKFGYGLFMFMPDQTDNDPTYENVMQLVNLQTKEVVNSHKCTVNSLIKSWQDDYFIYFKPETKPTMKSEFMTSHILGKKYLYMKMFQEMSWSKEMSSNFLQQIYKML